MSLWARTSALDEWLQIKVLQKGVDLGVTDVDWMSVRDGLHLAVLEFDSCSFTRTCNPLFLSLASTALCCAY